MAHPTTPAPAPTLAAPPLTADDVSHARRAVVHATAGAGTFEEAAHRACAAMYAELRAGGDRAAVLVRCFKSHALGALDPARRSHAGALLASHGHLTPAADLPCLALMGSCGVVDAWGDCHASSRYRVIPLPGPADLQRMPMFAAVLRDFGHPAAALWSPRGAHVLDLPGAARRRSYDVFVVDDAVGSPYVPAQREFVLPYRVRSVVGFGGPLRNGELYMVLAFLRCRLSPEAVGRLRMLALDLTTTFFGFDAARVFGRAGAP